MSDDNEEPGAGSTALAQVHEWNDPILRSSDVDADQCSAEMQSIEQQLGVASSENILAVARDPNTELHRAFDKFKAWDKKHAVHQFQLSVARRIAGSLRVVVHHEDRPAERKRVFIRPPKAAGYQTFRTVKMNVISSELTRQKAVMDLYAWIRRYEEICGRIPGVRSHIDAAIKTMRRGIETEKEAAE